MHVTEPAGIRVDPAILTALAARDDRRRRSLAAIVVREAARRSAIELRAREILADYLATSHHPVHLLVLPGVAPRPSL